MTAYDTEAGRRDPMYRLEGQLTDMILVGPVPDGIRLNGHFAGTITHGELSGASFSLVDYYRIRSDGAGIVNAYEVVELDGQRVSVIVHGFVLPPPGLPMPTVEEMTAPGFTFPDVPFRIEAAATFETAAPSLAHLNTTIVAHTGSVNLASGALFVEAWRVGDLASDRAAVAA